jgi:hypothetical protein
VTWGAEEIGAAASVRKEARFEVPSLQGPKPTRVVPWSTNSFKPDRPLYLAGVRFMLRVGAEGQSANSDLERGSHGCFHLRVLRSIRFVD